MDALKVLVVPSRATELEGFPSLPMMQREILAITNSNDATVLNEPVRWIDMLRAVTGDIEYDIIHYSGHMTSGGLVLGKEIIYPNQLIMMIQTGNPSLVVVLSCDGEDAAERIASQCRCDVIYSMLPLDNDIAITFSIAFYAQLRKANSYREAFDVASTGESTLRYLEGKYTTVTRGDSLAADIADIKKSLFDPYGGRGFAQRLTRLEGIVEEYLPVWRAIAATFASTKTISSQMFTVIMALLVVLSAAVLFFAFYGANGGG